MRNKILILSQKHRDIQFIISDAKHFKYELQNHFDFKSIDEIIDSVPIITAEDINHNRFLLKDKSFSIESLLEFVLNFKQQKLESVLKPEDCVTTGAVKEVSVQEFDKFVLKSSKESFIMFYTKGCDYCKSLEKTLEKLGLYSTVVSSKFINFFFNQISMN